MNTRYSPPRHPWVQVDASGKPLYPFYHQLAGVFAILAAASAYLVFNNMLRDVPVSVSYFWFLLFGICASFLYPDDFTSWILLRGSGRKGISYFHEAPLRSWRKSLKQGGFLLLFLAASTYTLYFGFLLWSLSSKQPGIVATILLLYQLSPIVNTTAAYKITRDTCKSWSAYILGSAIIFAGIAVYRFELYRTANIAFLDEVALQVCLALLFNCVYTLARRMYSAKYLVDGRQAMQSVYVVALPASILWLLFDPAPFTLPSPEQFTVLFYLGFIPTALGGIVIARVTDRIGIPYIESVGAFRTLFAVFIGFIPFRWFHQEQNLTLLHFAGFALAILGMMVVVFRAHPFVKK
ncbi:MAG: hypothetical protein AAB634_03275 [Patescibacteria group bacterium]